MTAEQEAAAKAIGRTVESVASDSNADGCYGVRIDFTDGSSLNFEGGFIDGVIGLKFTPPDLSTPAHQNPRTIDGP